MIIAGLHKLTLIDFPGEVAATVFTLGCNFRCPYCHNPELVVPEKFNQPLTMEFLWSFLVNRIGKLSGVCITGGEPLMHADLHDFIHDLKQLGYKVKLDTNGYMHERLEDLINTGMLDYIAMDIKGDAEVYWHVTKNGNLEDVVMPRIEKSIKLIMESGIPYEFRTTICKPLHNQDQFIKIGELIKGARRYALQNYRRSKQVDEDSVFDSFNEIEIENIKQIIGGYVKEVIVRS